EVGPGGVLTGVASVVPDVPAVALDTDDESRAGLLRVGGAGWAAGAPVTPDTLFHGRLVRPLEVGQEFAFFASPCEAAPDVRSLGGAGRLAAAPVASDAGGSPAPVA